MFFILGGCKGKNTTATSYKHKHRKANMMALHDLYDFFGIGRVFLKHID
jgi:hypothetical protein